MRGNREMRDMKDDGERRTMRDMREMRDVALSFIRLMTIQESTLDAHFFS